MTGGTSTTVQSDCTASTLSAITEQADAHFDRGEYRYAKQLLQSKLACQEKTVPPDPLGIASTLGNLGQLSRMQGRLKEAEAQLTKARSIHETNPGANHRIEAGVLLALAEVYKAKRRYRDAELLVRNALEILEKGFGPSSLEVAGALNALGSLHAEVGDWVGAERHYRRALAQRQGGTLDIATSSVLYNLASARFNQGAVAEAEELILEALELRRRLVGQNHPSVIVILKTYETLLKKIGGNPKARRAN